MRDGLLTLSILLAVAPNVLMAQPAPIVSDPPISFPEAGSPILPNGTPLVPVPEPECGCSAVQFAADGNCGDLFWFSADYLLWWTKSGPISAPLLTRGSILDPVPGAFGQPNTAVLAGNNSVDFGTTNGMRFNAGFFLDADHRWSIEGSYFLLEQRSGQFGTASDAAGNPILGQPIINATNNLEQLEAIAIPGAIAGAAQISSSSRLQGWEANLYYEVTRSRNFSFELLTGFRAVDLDEDLQVNTQFNQLQNGFLTFLGQPLAGPVSETTFDHFNTQNHFYGGQIGARVNWLSGRWTLSTLGKIAFGVNQQMVQIDGASSLLVPGQVLVSVPGGVLAVASNSGQHFRDQFAVVPEVGVQVGYQLTDHLEGHVGYSFLYMNNVVRPGDQIDRVVQPALVPTDAAFGTAAGTHPAFDFHTSDYWAHGVNFGLMFHY